MTNVSPNPIKNSPIFFEFTLNPFMPGDLFLTSVV